MSRYLFHPKALPVSNIVEGFFEEMREKNSKAANGPIWGNSPMAEEFNAKDLKRGLLILSGCFAGAFAIYWILRIYL